MRLKRSIAKEVAHGALIALFMWNGSAGVALAQNPAPLAQPNLDLAIQGSVMAIARQADGGTVIGGSFTAVGGVPRSNLARLLTDGSVDPDWNPQVSGNVNALAIGSGGDVYVGGSFDKVGGLTRNRLAKVSGSGVGSVDPQWDPNASSTVYALALDTTGSAFVGGNFQSVGGVTRRYIAKLSAVDTGSVDATWNPSADGSVNALTVDGTDVYCGGNFTTIAGQPRQRLAKLGTTGLGAADVVWNPGADGGVNAIALGADGSIYVGGNFSNAGGLSRHGLVKLSTSSVGTVDTTWDPAQVNYLYVRALLIDGLGSVYVGGRFTTIGGQPRSNLAKLSTTGMGAADAAWDPSPNSLVLALAPDAAGGILAGGQFFAVGGQQHLGLTAIYPDGSPDVTANVEVPAGVTATVRQHNGGVIVSGYFVSANGLPRRNFLRLRPDGTLDPDWAPVADSGANALAVDSADAVFAGGSFNEIDGYVRHGFAKLAGGGAGRVDPDWYPSVSPMPFSLRTVVIDNNDLVYFGGQSSLFRVTNTGTGAVDPVWKPDPVGGEVKTLAFEASSGALYVGGAFTSIGNHSRKSLAKLATVGVGEADPDWYPEIVGGEVTALVLGNQGALFVGGSFGSIGGQLRNHLAKVSASGEVDSLWKPDLYSFYLYGGPKWPVASLALDSQGALFVGGDFSSVNGLSRYGLVKLESDGPGTVDTNWNPQANGATTALLVLPDDKVIVGGAFDAVVGQLRDGLVEFANPDQIFADTFE